MGKNFNIKDINKIWKHYIYLDCGNGTVRKAALADVQIVESQLPWRQAPWLVSNKLC